MREGFTPEEIASYRDQGFLHVTGLLDEAELAHWQSVITDAVEARLGRRLLGQPAGHRQNPYENVFLQLMLLSRTHADVRELMHNPTLGKLACRLAGIDRIHMWHDQALIKEPLANATAFHRDVPYWSFDSRQAISVWVALDDADVSNGCLYAIPGSQHLTDYENVPIGVNVGELVAKYPELASIEPVALPAKAGDAIYIDGMVAHGAGCNMTHSYRRAMTCAYMPHGAKFNGKKNILSEKYMSSLEIGDELNNEEELPTIFPA